MTFEAFNEHLRKLPSWDFDLRSRIVEGIAEMLYSVAFSSGEPFIKWNQYVFYFPFLYIGVWLVH